MGLPTLAALRRSLPNDLLPYPSDREVPSTPISAVHVSELPDPRQYLEGGELLLTTGLSAVPSVAWFRGYLARLQEVGVVAVALGLGPRFDEVPAAFATAAGAVDLPLFVVPPATRFLTITRRYWELSAVAGRRQVVDALAGHRALIEATAEPDPEAAVVRRLAGAVGGWSARLSPDGALVDVAPASARARARLLRDEVARLSVAGVHAAASLPVDGQVVVLHPLGVRSATSAGGGVAGYLAVGAPAVLTPEQHHLVLAGVAVLGAQARRRTELRAAELSARAPVLQLLLGGAADTARAVAALVAPEVLDGPVRPAVIVGAQAAAAEPVRELAADERCLVAWSQGRALRLLFADGADLDTRLTAALADAARTGARVSAALGPAADFDTLATVYPLLDRGAAAAAPGTVAAATAPGRPSLLTQLDGATATAWARGLLAPLLGPERTDLVRALVTYLRHGAAWEPAARELELHRHTLRYRVRRAEQLLGVDLADVDAAAEVWLACRCLGLA